MWIVCSTPKTGLATPRRNPPLAFTKWWTSFTKTTHLYRYLRFYIELLLSYLSAPHLPMVQCDISISNENRIMNQFCLMCRSCRNMWTSSMTQRSSSVWLWSINAMTLSSMWVFHSVLHLLLYGIWMWPTTHFILQTYRDLKDRQQLVVYVPKLERDSVEYRKVQEILSNGVRGREQPLLNYFLVRYFKIELGCHMTVWVRGFWMTGEEITVIWLINNS